MVHLEFIFNIFTILSEFIVLALLFFLYWKFKLPLLKHAIIFISPFSLGFLCSTIEVYFRSINPTGDILVYATLWRAISFAYGFYIIPYIVNKIINKTLSIKIHLMLLLFSLFTITNAVLEITINFSPGYYFILIMEFIIAAYILIIINIHKNRILITVLKKFFNEYSIITILLILFLTIDAIVYNFFEGFKYIFFLLDPLQIYFFLINIFIIKAIFKYFFKPESNRKSNISREFIDFYRITERETDIINMLILGYTSNEIGKKLFISTQTVKNYIYKIYQKANVNNKVEFINVLQSKSFEK